MQHYNTISSYSCINILLKTEFVCLYSEIPTAKIIKLIVAQMGAKPRWMGAKPNTMGAKPNTIHIIIHLRLLMRTPIPMDTA